MVRTSAAFIVVGTPMTALYLTRSPAISIRLLLTAPRRNFVLTSLALSPPTKMSKKTTAEPAAKKQKKIAFMKQKSEAERHIENYIEFILTQTQKRCKAFRFNGGGEYVSKSLREKLESKGIKVEITAPYSPAQNGVAEHLNRTILERAHAMLAAYNLPHCLWPEAVSYAVYLIKQVRPTSGRARYFLVLLQRFPKTLSQRLFFSRACNPMYLHVPSRYKPLSLALRELMMLRCPRKYITSTLKVSHNGLRPVQAWYR